MRVHAAGLVLILTVAVGVAGCGASIGPASWELGMITPDERGLVVWFGTARGLESFTVTEDPDAVTIDVLVEYRGWGPRNGAFSFDSRFVELEEPLGDRTLRGCRRDDCRTFQFDLALGGDVIVVTPEVIATGYPDTEQHYFDRQSGQPRADQEPVEVPKWSRVQGTTYPAEAPDLQVRVERVGLYVETREGEQVWSTSLLPDYDTAPIMAENLVILAASGPDERGSRIIAYDLGTADVRWEREPFARTLEAAGDGLLVTLAVPRGDIHSTELVALDVKTGERRWRTDLRALMGDVVAVDRKLFVSIHRGLVALDPATGEIIWWSHVDGGLWTPTG